ncbi:MAG: AraC family transcriptional regulator ligand-binding domain-containing protein [Pseudomonadota bacterium]
MDPTPRQRNAPTVSREWMAGILTAAERQGVARTAVAAACGVPADAWNQPRCPLPLCVAAWEAAARLTGDPLFGLHAGGSLLPAQFNLLSHVLAQGNDLASALLLARRYLPLVSDGGTVDIDIGDHLEVRYRPLTHGWRYSHHQIDAALLAIVRLVDWIAAGRVTPLQVQIARPAPPDTAPYAAAFGCPVQFGRPHDAVLFPLAPLGQVLGGRDDTLRRLHARDRAEHALIELRRASWSARARRLIVTGLPSGLAGRRDVAAALRVSERTLQRRLADEGRDFAGLLAQARRELAIDYLAAGLTPAETSRLLGYSEPAAFHRAFAGWTGLTPGAYARQAAKRAPHGAADPAAG